IFREGRRAPDSRGDTETAEIGALPGSLLDFPRHHGLIAVDEDLGIRNARAGEDICGSRLDIVTLDTCGIGDTHAGNQQSSTPGCQRFSHVLAPFRVVPTAVNLHRSDLGIMRTRAIRSQGSLRTWGLRSARFNHLTVTEPSPRGTGIARPIAGECGTGE